MRRLTVVLAMLVACVTAEAQQRTPPRRPGAMMGPGAAENAVRQAAERLANDRRGIEVALRVLRHIRNSDRALIDPMQPAIAVQKAFEEMSEAERVIADPILRVGIIRARQALEAARNSPASADFGRLRAAVREEALGPVSRAVIRSATGYHEEALAWIAVQEQIATHLKTLAEITGEGLRAAQED